MPTDVQDGTGIIEPYPSRCEKCKAEKPEGCLECPEHSMTLTELQDELNWKGITQVILDDLKRSPATRNQNRLFILSIKFLVIGCFMLVVFNSRVMAIWFSVAAAITATIMLVLSFSQNGVFCDKSQGGSR